MRCWARRSCRLLRSEELNVVFGEQPSGSTLPRSCSGIGMYGSTSSSFPVLGRPGARAGTAREPGEQRRLLRRSSVPLCFEREFADYGISRAETGARLLGLSSRRTSTWPSRMPLAPWKSPSVSLSTADVAERARAERRDRGRCSRGVPDVFFGGVVEVGRGDVVRGFACPVGPVADAPRAACRLHVARGDLGAEVGVADHDRRLRSAPAPLELPLSHSSCVGSTSPGRRARSPARCPGSSRRA